MEGFTKAFGMSLKGLVKLGHRGEKENCRQEGQTWGTDQAHLGQSEAPSSGHSRIVRSGGEQALIAPLTCTQPEVKAKLEFPV